MKFGYTILYVADVAATVKFYQDAFGFQTRFVHDGGDYAELETGEVTLAFASVVLGDANLPAGFTRLSSLTRPAGIEIAFVTQDVPAAFENAVRAGATVIAEAVTKPWGQMVAYVRAPDGCLVELCTPVQG